MARPKGKRKYFRPHRLEYALYRGDEFVDIGTADYLHERYGVSAGTLYNLSSPSQTKRREGRKCRGWVAVALSKKGEEDD